MEIMNRGSTWVRGNCVGRGSYGTVNLAVNKSDGQVFAVKSVDRSLGLGTQVEALENEIRILRSLSSPWVVEYLRDDVTVEGGATSFRNLHLEYLPGGAVADLAKSSGADVGESIVRSFTWCIVSALRYVHSQGIVHCDVKGRNVLVGPIPGAAKLADFGAAMESAAVRPPRGSPLWMAPEVIRRECQGPESDVWSLGCTVIEMLTGKPAWEDRGVDTLFRIGYSDDLPVLPTQLSGDCRDFLDKCLRRNRFERWSCDQLLSHPFISSSAPPNSTTDSSPRCVLDWLNSEFFDEEEEEEEEDHSSLACELRTHTGRHRIGELASNTRATWESDGWVTVRNLIGDRVADVSDLGCRGDNEVGTSSEHPNHPRIEEEIGGMNSEYFDSEEMELSNLECSDSGGGLVAETARCHRGGDWVDDSGRRRDFSSSGVNLLFTRSMYVTAMLPLCIIYILLVEISIILLDNFIQTLQTLYLFSYSIFYFEILSEGSKAVGHQLTNLFV